MENSPSQIGYRAFRQPLPDDNYDYDYDYDVYLFCPSSSPYLILADKNASKDGLTLSSPSQDDLPSTTQALQTTPSLSRPPSTLEPLEFSQMEYSDEGGALAGYSRLFRAGLLSRSQQFSRRIDEILRIVQKGIRSTKRRLSL